MPSKLCTNSKDDCPKLLRDRGAALIFCTLCLFVFVGITALSIDIGRAYAEQRRLQFAADAASMAAVLHIADGANAVKTEASAILDANGFSDENAVVECANWDQENKIYPPPFVECSTSSGANAVVVEAKGSVQMKFARVLGPNFLNLVRPAIAMRELENSVQCIKPFGIHEDFIADYVAGDVFEIGSHTAGMWGKLAIADHNINGVPEFRSHMIDGVCHAEVAIGQPVPVNHGVAGLQNPNPPIFQQLIGEELFMAVYGPLENEPYVIKKFVELTYVPGSSQGGGIHWKAKFTVVNDDADPPTQGTSGASPRTLVF